MHHSSVNYGNKNTDIRFGIDTPKQPLNGEVKTYKLSDEELAQLREETGYRMLDLKKETYTDLKAQGKSDMAIANELDISIPSLTRYKAKWGLAGYRGRPTETTTVDKPSEERTVMEAVTTEDESNIEAGVIKDSDLNPITFIADEIVKADPIPVTVDLWIVMDTTDDDGPDSIKGIFSTEVDAKLFLADHALNKSVSSDYLHLTNRQVEVKG